MSKLLVATYTIDTYFKIPKEIDLENKDIVKQYCVKWDILYIYLTNGNEIRINRTKEDEPDWTAPYETEIIDEEIINEDEDEEEDPKTKPCSCGCKVIGGSCEKGLLIDNEEDISDNEEDKIGNYTGDIYGCVDKECEKCVNCNPLLWWLKRRPISRSDKAQEVLKEIDEYKKKYGNEELCKINIYKNALKYELI